jgi:hypothetical protein
MRAGIRMHMHACLHACLLALLAYELARLRAACLPVSLQYVVFTRACACARARAPSLTAHYSLNGCAGRSGSFFMMSADRQYIFKTIPKHEVDTLLSVLEDYARHVTSRPSRLMKFLALHRFTFAKPAAQTIYLVVASNMFFNPLCACEFEQKFDLKGTTQTAAVWAGKQRRLS